MTNTPAPAVELHPVDARRWDGMARLFKARGGPSSCWCNVFRADADERKIKTRTGKQAVLRKRVDAGTPIGLLAYIDGEPVGWCSVAPRESFTREGASLGGPPADPGEVWSLTCFYVSPKARGKGLMRVLMEGARDHAKAQGASVLEAYQVDEDSPSYRFLGFIPAFRKAGYDEVGMAGKRRHVMRLAL
jgi:GNAT superfamily N-acetyltransferase